MSQVTLLAVALALIASPAAAAGTVEVWGDRVIPAPADLTGFVDVVSNGDHNAALRADGSVFCWGDNQIGECVVPDDLPPCVDLATSFNRTMAVTTDGTIVAWGFSYFGGDAVPAPNADWVDIAVFDEQSVGLKSDGTVHLWGEIELAAPEPDSLFVKIAAGYAQALALTEHGSIVHFGIDYNGSATVPEPNTDFIDLAVGDGQALGLKSDGSIVGWGWNHHGQAEPTLPNSGYQAVACGYFHSLGLRDDGSVEAFGSNSDGQCGIRPALADPVAVSMRNNHGVALGADGTIATWGEIDAAPESAVPYTAVVAAYQGAAALKADSTLVTWGDWGGSQYPEIVPNSGFISVSAGHHHVALLRDDGSIATWGGGPTSVHVVPEPNSGFVSVSASRDYTVALRGDGTIEAWGEDNGTGVLDPPSPDPSFVSVLAASGFGIALRDDGTAACWGDRFAIPPEDNHDLVAVDAMFFSTVAGLRSDGSLVIWADNPNHALIPGPNEGFTAVTAGSDGVAAIRGGGSATAVPMPWPDRPTSGLVIAASPNPFNPRVAITVTSPRAATVRLEVLDVRGRHVRTLWRGQLAADAAHTASWDGLDTDGRAVPSGVYLVEARAPGEVWATDKIMLLR